MIYEAEKENELLPVGTEVNDGRRRLRLVMVELHQGDTAWDRLCACRALVGLLWRL